jgi:phosphatidylinositol alpha 1,6-mannosyltransferase
VIVRISVITESFPPDVNGVAHCALRVAEHLVDKGHSLQVIAPRPPGSLPSPDNDLPYEILRVPSVPMPGYATFRVAAPAVHLRAALTRHRTELVHLAAPFLLGAGGALAARRLGLPTIAVYQTDMPSYARAYHYGRAGQAIAWRRVRKIHNAAARTLAPSSAAAASLHENGIERVWIWGRGVDIEMFDPAHRSEQLHADLAPDGELLVGYVGRIAPEKRVDLLAGIAALPGVRLVIVGSGPAEAAVRRAIPGAVFLGQRRGADLATIYASLDLFVHSGPHETFGQTLQEAAASGLPVIAPAAGGPLDLVDDGVTGFLVAPDDAGALARAVARLAADPGLRAAQARAARRRVLGRTWQALGDELIGHYEAVLEMARAVEVPA